MLSNAQALILGTVNYVGGVLSTTGSGLQEVIKKLIGAA